MLTVKNAADEALRYIKSFLKWTVLAILVGLAGGVTGSLFHECVDAVTNFRTQNVKIIFLLPLGGIVIAAIYDVFRSKGHIDTNRVIEAVRENESVPLVMAPLIFVSTVITHLLGGSAGREGAALQLGGSIGYNLGKVVKLNKNDTHIIVMAGMSSVFSALFGTPLTAAFFAIEVVSVGIMHYAALVPCLVSSLVAYEVAGAFNISPVCFDFVSFPKISVSFMAKVALLAALCALLSIAFCESIKKCEHISKRFMPNKYVRAFVGGAFVVALTAAIGSYDYNGAGMDVITRAMNGNALWYAFILKIVFTAITISAGFKGGEIVPTFFIGSTFGCVIGALLGLDAPIGAAIGFVALFCGVVNCPVASTMLALEVFGGEAMAPFAIVCAISYMLSGCFGLYKSQKIVYSKINEEYIDVNTR